jgi:hypothetical protein
MCSKSIRESLPDHCFRVTTLIGGGVDPEYQGVSGSPPGVDVVVRYRS